MRTSFIKGFSTALSVFTERFILFAAITTFVLIGGDIRAGITFSLVQYYNLLQLACNIFFPLALASLAESRVSIRRLEVIKTKIFFLLYFFLIWIFDLAVKKLGLLKLKKLFNQNIFMIVEVICINIAFCSISFDIKFVIFILILIWSCNKRKIKSILPFI